MALNREQLENFMHGNRKKASIGKWYKKQMNKYIRLNNKNIDDDDVGYKTNRKPTKGWEF